MTWHLKACHTCWCCKNTFCFIISSTKRAETRANVARFGTRYFCAAGTFNPVFAVLINMSRLYDCPPEVVEKFFESLDMSPYVISLWKCGYKRLNGLLGRGIKSMALVDRRFNSTSRFPRMLIQLRALTRLDIGRGMFSLMDVDRLQKCLMQLSPTLHSIRFYFHEAEQVFVEPLQINPSMFDETHVGPVTNLVTGGQLINVAGTFPKLTYLWLDGYPELRSHHVSQLPDSLTEIALPKCRPEIFGSPLLPQAEMIRLPSQLLYAFVPKLSDVSVATIASMSNLECLAGNGRIEGYELQRLSKSLPPQLTGLSHAVWDLYLKQTIPPLLKSMCIEFPTSVEHLLLLPQHLTSLQIYGVTLLKKAYIAALPRTLLVLKVPGIDWSDDFALNASDFPNLVKIDVKRSGYMQPNDWDLLPSHSLTSIIVTTPSQFDLQQLHLDKLARFSLLVELQCSVVMNGVLSKEYTSINLTSLTLSGFAIDFSSLQHLPTSLTSLGMSVSVYWPASFLHLLPRSITLLDLASIAFSKLHAKTLVDLPPNVRDLRLQINLSHLDVMGLTRIPKTCVALQFVGIDCSNFCEALKYLPDTVLHLDLVDCYDIDPCLLCRLPRKLKTFGWQQVVSQRRQFKDEYMMQLPRTLERLTFDGIRCFSTAIIPHLPPHLMWDSLGRW